ncbi:peptide/nickel transport system substrate-binding protein [Nocardia amikacinitolerans]|uniref:ABC transporter substrate-binding protein n=1 Tax=Nocardia amikacinitolerans TaxID=756689 RepID=UPI000833ECEC|nr:ABC transporter substrate-binding protein [Nocardia amikacinitolerans]MCP2316191.1 peptide/nickel transport system substrate-binding protein [Nocardia amikacinitolerans]
MDNSTGSRRPLGRRELLLRGAGAAGLVALGGIGVLTGCGTDGSTGAPEGPPRAGGRLRSAIAGRAASVDVLDPHRAGSSAGGAVSKNVWDKLVAYNNDLTLRYRLAQSLEPNADGSEWRITLRPGVVFSDGTPLTARDVLWSFERMLDPAKPSSGDLAVVDMGRTRADGELGVVVAMKTPIADFGSVLAGWYCYVVKDGSTVFDERTLPVGTGPFALHSWSPGDRTVLRRNEKYWDGPVHLDEVEIIQIAETEARMNAFLSGEVDLVQEMSYLQARSLDSDPDAYVVTPPAGLMGAFQMRVDEPPFDDVRVRQAMRLAVDRQAMVDSVYYGYGEVGNDIYGKGAPFYNDSLPQRTYDPERARQLLKEAGKENLTVTLQTADAIPGMVESATLFAEHAKAAGITIRLETVPADTYFSRVSGKQPLTHIGWWNYSLDYFYGQTMTSASPSNGTGWRRPAWDAKFAAARAEMNEQRRRQLYFELQEELWNEGGYILHSFAKRPDAARKRVRGVRDGVPGTDDWANFATTWLAS